MTRALPCALASCALACALVSCAPTSDDAAAAVTLSTPRALLECAAPPAGLAARMFISGSELPCPLEVDLAAGTTTGACDARPGLVRTLTIEWFAPVAIGGDDVELVLAQATGTVDLTQNETGTATFTVADDDVVTTGCVDPLTGDGVVVIGGVDVPVCDADESCGDEDGACTNLGELCAGTDPFDAGDEP